MTNPSDNSLCIVYEECSGHGTSIIQGGICTCDTEYMLDPNDDSTCIPYEAPECTNLTYSPTDEAANYGEDEGKTWKYFGSIGETELMLIENYEEYSGPTSTGTYTFTATEADYLDCGFCIQYFLGENENIVHEENEKEEEKGNDERKDELASDVETESPVSPPHPKNLWTQSLLRRAQSHEAWIPKRIQPG